ncbi:related to extracellular aspartic proteinase [Sporisorium reilianum SRZ2]|uniref:Related to extracellular aspartic proteinase n=1 Tax=Sporisorium reilianum (strain SRZ2) TaxID=999809 RepID=E7A0F3_SPORE|nr:related to extracellular aspartic proteinase [Sporisorium reilianum SRZ2]
MKKFSNQFLTLLLVLLSIGALDFHTLLSHVYQGSVKSGSWPAASAAPLYANSDASTLQSRSRKPRVGIVVKGGSDSSLTKSAAPLNTVTTGGSKSGTSTFENPDGRVGMNVQLKRLERNQEGNPLMLYQRHINRANSKLASILGRTAPTSEQMQQALERRKLSILSRRDLLSDSTPLVTRSMQRTTNPRQEYTTHPESGGDMQRRFLSSIMDDLFGRTGLEGGSKAKSTIQQVANQGYPQADLIASQSDNLTLASAPTAVQSLGLDIESNDIGYVATIAIGSQNQTFRMLIDSGSADTWVPSTACAACGSTHTQLGSSTSDTFTSLATPFEITYGTGDVSGNLARDDLEIAGLALTNYTFAVTTRESADFADDTVPFDGLMGLARSELSNAGQPTPIDALYAEGKVQAPVMGYHLGRVADGYNDGEVTFGGVDPVKYAGNITEIDNVSTKGFWEADIDAVSVGGADLGLQGRTAILDTGTTLIVAPQADADVVHAKIKGSKSDGQGGYTIPCTTTAQVALTFGGVQFPIDTRDMLFLPVDSNDLEGDCVSAISAGNVGQKNEWLVGATFLKNVYFATNTKANKIGLAKLNTTDTSNSTSAGKSSTSTKISSTAE